MSDKDTKETELHIDETEEGKVEEKVEAPDKDVEASDDKEEDKVKSNVETPDEDVETPDENIETVDEDVETPDENIKTVDKSETLDENEDTESDKNETPDEDVETPDSTSKALKFKKVHTPEKTYTDFISDILNGKSDNIVKLVLIAMITFPLLLLIIGLLPITRVQRFSAAQKVDYSGIDISVTMSEDDLTLDYTVNNAVVKLDNGKYIEINKDTLDNVLNTDLNIINNTFEDNGIEYTVSKDLSIDSFDNYNDMLYIVYKNEETTGMRELLVSKELKGGLVIDGLQSVNNDIYESNSTTSVNAFTTTYDNSIIYYSDQLLGGEIGTKTLVSRVQAIENNMKYSTLEEGGHEEVTIRFDELKDLKLSTLSSLKEAPGAYFSESDGVLRLHNYVDDKAYVFISHVNNNLFFCNASDLLETNYDNLYVTRGFDDVESTGYRTFVITTENNMYAFRVSSEAPDSLVTELLNEFGYDRNSLTVKPVQEMVANEVVEDSLDMEGTTEESSDVTSEETTETEKTGESNEENN